MKRRILATTMAVTAAAVSLFAVAFGWALGRTYRSQELSRLHQAATRAVAAVPADGLHGADPLEPPPSSGGIHLAYYDAAGAAVAGDGPTEADRVVRRAVAGRATDGGVGGRLVAAEPIISNETTLGAVEASSAASAVRARTVRSWLAIALLGAAALALTSLIASWLARRLGKPVDQLVRAAEHLGDGNFALTFAPSGIPEIDAAGRSLQSTASRLGEVIERERAFTARASHQLRTPLTSLRLTLDNALETPGVDVRAAATQAAAEAERLQRTLEELLSLNSPGASYMRHTTLNDVLDEVEQRWRPILAERGRRLDLRASSPERTRLVPRAIEQVLDILVDNAATHGRGTVTVGAQPVGDGVALDVEDEGDGPITLPDRTLSGRNGHGVGLSLARTLTESAGGRLVVKRAGPRPLVRAVLPDPNEIAPNGRRART